MTPLEDPRLDLGPKRRAPRAVRWPGMSAGALVAALLVSGCGSPSEDSTAAPPEPRPCHSYAGYGSEQARLEASEMVVVGTLRRAEDTGGERIYELVIEEEIMGAPELAGDAVEFSVPDDCDGSPASLPEFGVGDRVKAYLRSADANTLHGPMTVLSPHEGLEAVES